MKAAVCVAGGTLELRDWPEPRAGAGELLLRLRGCGLCGSDIAKLVSGGPRVPTVLGHEVVGEVMTAGHGAGFAPGQRVVVAHHVPCFACHYCRRGSPSMCRTFKRSNLDPGGFAERLRVPAANVAHATFPVPDSMSDETASFTEPLACCLRAARRAGVGSGDVALVVGLGSIGCLTVQALRRTGARVLAADLRAERRVLGRRAGATVLDTDDDLDAALAEATEGRGADLVLLTAGGTAALGRAATRVRDGGALHCFAGGAGDGLPLALDTLYGRELTVTATYSSSPEDLAEALRLLSTGAVTVDWLVTHRLPLARLAEGVELMKEQRAVKVYVTP
jgi:L-iditol 2-dehydrogenase